VEVNAEPEKADNLAVEAAGLAARELAAQIFPILLRTCSIAFFQPVSKSVA
jgi:hypothetical protein